MKKKPYIFLFALLLLAGASLYSFLNNWERNCFLTTFQIQGVCHALSAMIPR